VKNNLTNEWRVLGESESKSQNAAIKDVAGEQEGDFAAVPTRSWQPIRVERVTVTRRVTTYVGDEDVASEAQADEEATDADEDAAAA
jgi:hypothetical protein